MNFRQSNKVAVIVLISFLAVLGISPCLCAAAASDPVAPADPTAVLLDAEPADNLEKKEENDTSITFHRKQDLEVKNPFPQIISEEEIEALDDKKYEAAITKFFFTRDGANAQPEPLTKLDMPKVKGKLTVYMAFKHADEHGRPQGVFATCGQNRHVPPLQDGSIYAGSDTLTKYDTQSFTMEFNGKVVAQNSLKAVQINVDTFKNNVYMKMTYDVDPAAERLLFNLGSTGTVGGYTQTFIHLEFNPPTKATFHFVDDFAYRHLQNLPLAAALPERGNSDRHPLLSAEEDKKGTILSALPFTPIAGLPDLITAQDTGIAYYMRNTSGDVKTPLLSYAGEGKADASKHPTLEALTGQQVPGYIYYANDIDKPEGGVFADNNETKDKPGNHYLSFAYKMKDGKPVERLTNKHYYLTYRAIPTKVAVQQYVEEDGKKKPITQGKYDLYRKDGVKETLVCRNTALSSDFAQDTAPDLSELVNVVKNTAAYKQEGYYQTDKGLYLIPGDYILRQTEKVAGYAAVPDLKFTVKRQLQAGQLGGLTGEESTLKTLSVKLKKETSGETPGETFEKTPKQTLLPGNYTAVTSEKRENKKIVAKTGETAEVFNFGLYCALGALAALKRRK